MKKSPWRNLWPQITDAESARKAAYLGAGVAFWVAGLTAVFAVLGMLNVFKLLDGSALVDATIFAVIGFFVRSRMSRVAAVLGLAFYIIERVYMVTTKGASAGLGILAILFTLYFIAGVRGTFAYHRFAAPDSPESDAKAA